MSYEVYHKSFTAAIQEMERFATKSGFDLDKEEMAVEIGFNSKRPREGETEKFFLSLYKEEKLQKKKIHSQIYCMGESFELNVYIL